MRLVAKPSSIRLYSAIPGAPDAACAPHALHYRRGLSMTERDALRRFALLFAAFGVFFGAYSAVYFRSHPVNGTARAAIYLCLILLIGLALAPGFPELRARLRLRVTAFHGVILFLLPYLIYAAGTGDFRWIALAKLFGLAAWAFGLCAAGLAWLDVLVLLGLMLPVIFGQVGGIWNVPENLDFMVRMFLLGVGTWAFLIVRQVENSGYEFRLPPAAAKDAALGFAGFTAVALPLGFALRFIAWNPHWRGIWPFLFDYATIFLFIAILEEFFFRGIFQNLLEGWLHSRYGAQAIAAVVFGLSHIRHAPYPNWRYVALATVAGWFYGYAYRNHRCLMASAVTHAMVDTLWRTFLTLPKA